MHTQSSDGSGSIAEMAEAAAARGYEYIAVPDHSKGLKIAGGIDEEQLRARPQKLLRSTILWGATASVRVLRSVELNLDPAGLGDVDRKRLLRSIVPDNSPFLRYVDLRADKDVREGCSL